MDLQAYVFPTENAALQEQPSNTRDRHLNSTDREDDRTNTAGDVEAFGQLVRSIYKSSSQDIARLYQGMAMYVCVL